MISPGVQSVSMELICLLQAFQLTRTWKYFPVHSMELVFPQKPPSQWSPVGTRILGKAVKVHSTLFLVLILPAPSIPIHLAAHPITRSFTINNLTQESSLGGHLVHTSAMTTPWEMSLLLRLARPTIVYIPCISCLCLSLILPNLQASCDPGNWVSSWGIHAHWFVLNTVSQGAISRTSINL